MWGLPAGTGDDRTSMPYSHYFFQACLCQGVDNPVDFHGLSGSPDLLSTDMPCAPGYP